MDEGRCGLREYFQCAYISLQFVLLFPQINHVLPVSSAQHHLQLFLFQLLFNLIQLLKVGKLIFIPADKRNLVNRPK